MKDFFTIAAVAIGVLAGAGCNQEEGQAQKPGQPAPSPTGSELVARVGEHRQTYAKGTGTWQTADALPLLFGMGLSTCESPSFPLPADQKLSANINLPQSKLAPGTYPIEPRAGRADRIEAVVQRHLIVGGAPSSEAWVLDTGTLTIERADAELVSGVISARKANDPNVDLVGKFAAAVCNAPRQ
jgi:hypothetical protein